MICDELYEGGHLSDAFFGSEKNWGGGVEVHVCTGETKGKDNQILLV